MYVCTSVCIMLRHMVSLHMHTLPLLSLFIYRRRRGKKDTTDGIALMLYSSHHTHRTNPHQLHINAPACFSLFLSLNRPSVRPDTPFLLFSLFSGGLSIKILCILFLDIREGDFAWYCCSDDRIGIVAMSLRPLIEQRTCINAYPFPFYLVKIWSEDHFVPSVVLGCGAVRCGFFISLGWVGVWVLGGLSAG